MRSPELQRGRVQTTCGKLRSRLLFVAAMALLWGYDRFHVVSPTQIEQRGSPIRSKVESGHARISVFEAL